MVPLLITVYELQKCKSVEDLAPMYKLIFEDLTLNMEHMFLEVRIGSYMAFNFYFYSYFIFIFPFICFI